MLNSIRIKKNIDIFKNVFYNEDKIKKNTSINPIKPPHNGSLVSYWAVVYHDKKPTILLQKQFGYKSSQDGEAHEMCFIKENKEISGLYKCNKTNKRVIAKLIPVDAIGVKNYGNIKYSPWKELFINKLLTKIVGAGLTPHFIRFYGGYYCDRADESMFKNVNIIKRFKNKRLITSITEKMVDIGVAMKGLVLPEKPIKKIKESYDIFNQNIKKYNNKNYGHGCVIACIEKMENDLSTYINFSPSITIEEVAGISFQILHALYILHEYCGIVHLDLHLNNVLIESAKKKEGDKKYYRHYSLKDGKEVYNFYVPNYDIHTYIIDFGRSNLLRFMTSEDIAQEAKSQYAFLINEEKAENFYKKVKHNISRNRNYYKEYLKSFDVMRVFVELYWALKPIADRNTIKFIQQIAMEAKNDFEIKFTQKENKIKSTGKPIDILKKYFVSNYARDLSKSNIYIRENYMDNNDFIFGYDKSDNDNPKKVIKQFIKNHLAPRKKPEEKK